jgi:hypothetical protein
MPTDDQEWDAEYGQAPERYFSFRRHQSILRSLAHKNIDSISIKIGQGPAVWIRTGLLIDGFKQFLAGIPVSNWKYVNRMSESGGLTAHMLKRRLRQKIRQGQAGSSKDDWVVWGCDDQLDQVSIEISADRRVHCYEGFIPAESEKDVILSIPQCEDRLGLRLVGLKRWLDEHGLSEHTLGKQQRL